MSDGTAGVLLVSSLAVLFFFPLLRPAAARVLKWGAISLAVLFVTCLLSMCFAEAGADPNAPPSDTPLDAAVEKGHEGTAAVLMEAGGVHSTPVSRGLSMLHTLMAGLLLGSLIPWM
ncbi:hypothetical protein EMIHUDRAFT_105579 [Emiliania huxleyi CCMP1516]|uniref:Uncharacterized protein n=2 Tax=Emiliania huxleyi TaxID=2903 RepID=A0A0D3IF21_EMIH1|nr:hypothetical protein EMIHUDRAFT_105579 [Emiliania huxleyi CCMP1516]EOD09856.1 hypothetical protein EMIHUDRAFT_105579 [Emiliania huxleyi CCMP1516]|eukprot:XP_005762285.1 hypothetical protein EMIHUDRAFT_105579 [Emiliania huxleyi CCMP1516]